MQIAGAIAGALLGTAPTAGAAVFSCDDPGIQTAAATGGGPHTFSCAGPTTVTVSGTLAIFASVILDGGGDLTVSGGNAIQVFSVGAGSVELRDLERHGRQQRRQRRVAASSSRAARA